MSDPTEQQTRTAALAEALVKAAEAGEAHDWAECQRLCSQAAWQARMLTLLEKDIDPD